ncbi:MAG: riboflavin synthase [Candidatus Margulisbacteria bacterium]|nr:riboflavin synthase [Candidatus Margulisiibacteriota bacterium]
MFTGIIEELGIITSIIRGSEAGKIIISVSKDLAVTKVGDSIAVNGVCLTVTSVRRNFLEFDISSESLKKAAFSDLKIGDKVNLERALMLSNRLGGHLVTGHVDGVGEIRKKVTQGKAFDLYISLPSELLKYLVPKGSITLDGISLTVADIREALAVVSVVPHTVKSTNLGFKGVGDRVNIEVDILSKYIERHLSSGMRGLPDEAMSRVGYLPMGWIDN